MRRLVKRKDKNEQHQIESVGVCHTANGKVHHVPPWPADIDEGAGNDRVCNSRRGARGHRDHRGRGVSRKAAGALDRYFRRDQRVIEIPRGKSGQSTVEFAVVTAGFLAVTVALGLMWHAFGDGLLLEHALSVASHHVQTVAPAVLVDIFLY